MWVAMALTATVQKEKSRVTYDGRTVVDTNALLRSDKVRETLDKVSRVAAEAKRTGRVIVLKKRSQ